MWSTNLGLSAYTKAKYYNILECVVVGWELISMRNKKEYKPYLVIYPLWEDSLAQCMGYPLLLMPIVQKGIDLVLPYDSDRDYADQIKKLCYSVIPFDLGGDIPTGKFISFIKDSFATIDIRSNFVLQIKIYRLLYGIYLYLGEMESANDVYRTLKQKSQFWDKEILNYWYGDLSDWLDYLRNTSVNRYKFIANINSNLKEKQISKVRQIHFI